MIDSLTLKNDIIRMLELDSDTETASLFNIYENLNIAQDQILLDFSLAEISQFKTYSTSDLIAAQCDYSFPSDCIKVLNISIAFDNHEAIPASPLKTLNVLTLDKRGFKTSPKFELTGDGIKISPTPTANRTGGLLWEYIRRPAQMTDSVSSELKADLKGPLLFLAASFCCLVDNYRPELAARFREEYKTSIR